MRTTRPACAIDPRRFGRRVDFAGFADRASNGLNEDLRLFALTFVGGFLFFSILIG